jgi:hypothetical protein
MMIETGSANLSGRTGHNTSMTTPVDIRLPRYTIKHLIDIDNVMDWPRDLRHGPDVAIAADADAQIYALRSALTARDEDLAEALTVASDFAEADDKHDWQKAHARLCALQARMRSPETKSASTDEWLEREARQIGLTPNGRASDV